MIDFWEALGRLAYDQELFDQFQTLLGQPLPDGAYLPSEKLTTKKEHITATVLRIPRESYEKVQDFMRPILTEHYVSLFVAGELIWTFSRKGIREAFANLHGPISARKLHAPSTSYFITLGLLLVDKLFRDKVAKAGQDLSRLSDPERQQLQTVLCDKRFTHNMELFEDQWD